MRHYDQQSATPYFLSMERAAVNSLMMHSMAGSR